VSGRLRHGRPPPTADTRPWPLRRADLDVLDHVNNAVSWAAVEDALAVHGSGRRLIGAEIEYRAPIDLGEEPVLRADSDDEQVACWLTVGDEVRTSAIARFG
jgi:acyl-ACP thioesterase